MTSKRCGASTSCGGGGVAGARQQFGLADLPAARPRRVRGCWRPWWRGNPVRRIQTRVTFLSADCELPELCQPVRAPRQSIAARKSPPQRAVRGAGRHFQRQRRAQHQCIAPRPAFRSTSTRVAPGVVARIAACSSTAAQGCSPYSAASRRSRRTSPGAHIQREGTHRRGFVPAAGTVHDEGPLDGHACQRLRHQARGWQVVGADHVKRRRGRIGQRPQDIEHRAHAQCGAHRPQHFMAGW